MQKGSIFNSVVIIGASLLALLWLISLVPTVLESIGTTYREAYEISPLKLFKGAKLLPARLDNNNGTTNMLLLGISGSDYISGYLTDTIILASINTENTAVHFFSIPRDLWVPYDTTEDKKEWQKINELYRLGGGVDTPDVTVSHLVRKKVEEITGQPVHYTGVINLHGVQEVVDMMGGIETEEGYMNGEEALDYIRDRSRPGGDFDRMLRQQKVLVALMNKASRYTAGEQEDLLMLFEKIEHNTATDAPLLTLLQLYEMADHLSEENIYLHAITADNFLRSDYTEVNGQQLYTLHPKAGAEDYNEIQMFIQKTITTENTAL